MKSRFTHWLSPLLVTGGIVALLVLAVFLVNRESSNSVAHSAEMAMVADNTLGAVSAIRTATGYALSFSATIGSSHPVDDSLADIDSASEEIDSRVERLLAGVGPQDAASLDTLTAEYVGATRLSVDAMRQGRFEEASAHVLAQSAAHAELSQLLTSIRDDFTEDVLIADEDVGRAAEAVRFLILFLIPLAVIVAFWRTQRRLGEKRLLATELEKQTQIAKNKDDFVADVSHELRTPLTGIYGFAVALEENSHNLTGLQSELLGLIISESAELSRMVDDLVAIGRIDAGAVTFSPEDVDIATEIETVMKPFERQGVRFEYESGGLHAYVDPSRFRQILRNLLSNAVKYGDGEVAVAVYADTDSTVVEIIDNGPGVPEEVTSHLFERYVHTEGTALIEGSVGLGLAIAQAFAEGMGGKLTYRRTSGLTVFELRLPRSAADELAEPDQLARVSV